ncbi:MAG: glycosyltransferase family 2 protein [Bacillota bacterium]|nr:glycosyltransferase family 2 protein [Bacillota bacterium]
MSIVTYNNEKIIENTINSIVSNIKNGISYIIYVVDNASTDGTVEKIRCLEGNIRIIENKKNVGFGAGHNTVIDLLDSNYHIIINPDISVIDSAIEDMFKYCENNVDIGLLSPLIKYPDGEIQYLCKHNPTFIDLFIRLVLPGLFKKRQNYFTMRETGYNKIFEIEYATGCFMFFRTEVFKKIKGFDENIFLYLEDADITRRVNQVSKSIFYTNAAVIHEWQRGAHKSLKLMWINVKSAAYYFKKWGFRLY